MPCGVTAGSSWGGTRLPEAQLAGGPARTHRHVPGAVVGRQIAEPPEDDRAHDRPRAGAARPPFAGGGFSPSPLANPCRTTRGRPPSGRPTERSLAGITVASGIAWPKGGHRLA